MNPPAVRPSVRAAFVPLRRPASILRRAARRFDLGPLDEDRERPAIQPSPLADVPSIARVATIAARLSNRVEHPKLAERLLRRFSLSSVAGQIALGNALLAAGSRRVTITARVGTRTAWAPDPASAKRYFTQAVTADPTCVDAWLGVLRTNSLLDESHDAATAFDEASTLAPDDWRIPFWRADSLRLIGKRRGAMLQREAAEVRDCLQRVLDLRPDQHNVRLHLSNGHITVGDFNAAAQVAWPGGELLPAPESIDCSAPGQPPHPTPTDAPDLWRFSLHARELHRGAVTSAYAVKRALARDIATRPLPTAPAYADLDQRSRAMSYLGDGEAAASELAGHLRWWHSDAERLAVCKFQADTALQRGDVAPLCDFQQWVLDPHDPTLEERFADLVCDRAVAVVGPAPCDLEVDLSGFDTVITTKQLGAWVRSRASVISYYSDASAILDAGAIVELLKTGGLDVAVVRQSLLPSFPTLAHLDGQLRVMPTEDSTTFLSTRFGLQRIIYDVVKYLPSRLAVFGSDLFSGSTHYAGDYSNEVERLYEPGGFEISVSMSVHDYLADFEFTKQLAATGLIEVTPTLGALLDRDVDDYLTGLDRRVLA